MHHAIWIEHDGSWTWSIEEGKAFEDDHKVLARNDGFPTRGDAKQAMQEEWARLVDAGKKPGRLTKRTQKTNTKNESENEPASLFAKIPQWAVIENSAVLALFSTQKLAKDYVASNQDKALRVEKISIGISS